MKGYRQINPHIYRVFVHPAQKAPSRHPLATVKRTRIREFHETPNALLGSAGAGDNL